MLHDFDDCEEFLGMSFFDLLKKTKKFEINYARLPQKDKPKALIEFAVLLICGGQ